LPKTPKVPKSAEIENQNLLAADLRRQALIGKEQNLTTTTDRTDQGKGLPKTPKLPNIAEIETRCSTRNPRASKPR
jgi:hypothetical protein